MESIAITGIGCRAPGGIVDPTTFWHLLTNGVDAISEIPEDRWDADSYFDPDPSVPGKMSTRWGGFLKDIGLFDAGFFGISPREATWMDPQQRLMLEVAWEAIEDAGYTKQVLAGSRTGIFVGVSTQDYSYQDILYDPSVIDAYYATGSASSIVAGRISHFLDLRGPCLTTDTACSSSLVAVHLGCQNLTDGCCDIALAGGINLMLVPRQVIAFSKFGMMAADGRCKTFDARADGYVRGEGCGLIVLKRLPDAIADGDTIYAVIRGSAINQDGRGSGLTVPSRRAQEAVLQEAVEKAGIEANEITYLEAHGTGTSIGDPIEMEALKTVYGAPRLDGSRCCVGSVKTNIGHLEAASGVFGLIKTALCLQHTIIPPNLHFERLNPKISLLNTPFVIPTELTSWPASSRPRLAGVSSFGFSGTNAHVVLEEALTPDDSNQEEQIERSDRAYLFPVSGHNREALSSMAEKMRSYLTSDTVDRAYDICYTAGLRRTHFQHRMAVTGDSKKALADQLERLLNQTTSSRRAPVRENTRPQDGIVFVFSGQGAQWPGMGSQLYEQEPVFRAKIQECDEILSHFSTWSLVSELLSDESSSRLANTDILQPTQCALQIALTSLWQSWGIMPAVVVGHSIGEVAAAHVAGVLDLKSALYLAFHRGRLMQTAAGQGTMAAVGLTERDAVSLLNELDSHLSVAAVNSPTSVVLSGEKYEIENLGHHLTQKEILFRKLDVDYAFHSPQMEPFQQELESILRDLPRAVPSLTIVSSVTGLICNGEEIDAAYWGSQIRLPVHFARAIDTLITSGYRDFLEIGPHPVLNGPIYQCLIKGSVSGEVFYSLRRNHTERKGLLNTLGALYCLGYSIDWEGVYPKRGQVAHLPTYSWQRDYYWIGDDHQIIPDSFPSYLEKSTSHPLLGQFIQPATYPDTVIWQKIYSLKTIPNLQDHVINGSVIVPASAYVEMALSAVRQTSGEDTIMLKDIKFKQPLLLHVGDRKSIQLVISKRNAGISTFDILSNETSRDFEEWTHHASGTIQKGKPPTSKISDLVSIQSRCTEEYTHDYFYATIKERGLEYGPHFKGVENIWRRDGEAVGNIGRQKTHHLYSIDPGTLDACFQVLGAAFPGSIVSQQSLYLPVEIQQFVLYSIPDERIYSHVRFTDDFTDNIDQISCDITLFDRNGQILVEVSGFTLQEYGTNQKEVNLLEDGLFNVSWEVQPQSSDVVVPDDTANRSNDFWIIFGDHNETTHTITSILDSCQQQYILTLPGDTFNNIEENCFELNPSDPDHYQSLLQSIPSNGEGACNHILFLWSHDVPPPDETTLSSIEDSYTRGIYSLVHLVKALAEVKWSSAPRLWITTRSAQSITSNDTVVSIHQAPVWGLGRSIIHEHPSIQCSLIDLSWSIQSEELESLCKEIWLNTPENQIGFRSSDRYLARLTPLHFKNNGTYTPPSKRISEEESYRLVSLVPGQIDSLALQEVERRKPERDEIEIRIKATGLNFRDILKTLSIYPSGDDDSLWFGDECAGTVVNVGDDVTNYTIGDDVFAIAPFCFSSYLTLRTDLVFPTPSSLCFEEAASLPVAFLTAYYALVHLARIKKGDRVLIHVATGGVGLAAVQIALHVGAEVFATAGNEEKREFLRDLSIPCVSDSRSVSFVNDILDFTHEEGIDIVLNSLTGELLEASLKILRPFGRFLEIGKRDIYSNRSLGLEPFKKNLSFFAVDIDRLVQYHPQLCQELITEILNRFADASYRPLPLTRFPITEVTDAFHYMARAKHIGKIVLTHPDTEHIAVIPAKKRGLFDANGTYLITGGLGDIGITVGQWMVTKGARRLILLGIKEPDEMVLPTIEAMRDVGAAIHIIRADVAQLHEIKTILDEIQQSDYPLRGVFHLAGLLDDGILLRMDQEKMERVLRPKVNGAWNLHELTKDVPIDFFVLFSSVTSVIGSPGQSNYAAANAFMDALAHYRNAKGLPCTSINWGPWKEIGMAARVIDSGHSLALSGISSISKENGLAALDFILRNQNRAQLSVVPFNFQQWKQISTHIAPIPLLQTLLKGDNNSLEQNTIRDHFRESILSLDPGMPRRLFLEDQIREEIVEILRLSSPTIDRQMLFEKLGFDSLMALELRNRLQIKLGIALPETLLWSGHSSLITLAEYLARKLDVPLESQEQPSVQDQPGGTET